MLLGQLHQLRCLNHLNSKSWMNLQLMQLGQLMMMDMNGLNGHKAAAPGGIELHTRIPYGRSGNLKPISDQLILMIVHVDALFIFG